MEHVLADVEAVIFDLDGTLWDSSTCVSRGWQRAVQQQFPGLCTDISIAKMQSCMGKPMDEICENLFPSLNPQQRVSLLDECIAYEHEELRQAQKEWLFPGVRQTLEILSTRYPLAIASNCEEGYIENFLNCCQLGHLFCDFECWGHTGLSKGENICLLMERNHWENACMVGDTQMDQAAAAYARIPFVFARYGFGQATNCTLIMEHFEELLDLL